MHYTQTPAYKTLAAQPTPSAAMELAISLHVNAYAVHAWYTKALTSGNAVTVQCAVKHARKLHNSATPATRIAFYNMWCTLQTYHTYLSTPHAVTVSSIAQGARLYKQ